MRRTQIGRHRLARVGWYFSEESSELTSVGASFANFICIKYLVSLCIIWTLPARITLLIALPSLYQSALSDTNTTPLRCTISHTYCDMQLGHLVITVPVWKLMGYSIRNPYTPWITYTYLLHTQGVHTLNGSSFCHAAWSNSEMCSPYKWNRITTLAFGGGVWFLIGIAKSVRFFAH